MSCTEPGWAELVRLGWHTPQRAAKINHWCFTEILWLWSFNSEDHSHERVTEWPHTEQRVQDKIISETSPSRTPKTNPWKWPGLLTIVLHNYNDDYDVWITPKPAQVAFGSLCRMPWQLMKRKKKRTNGVRWVTIIKSDLLCLWKSVPWLSSAQARGNDQHTMWCCKHNYIK